MFDMFELIRRTQGGGAFDHIARAYGMTPEQMRAATAALTPAFAQGFQRQSQSDAAARRLHELMGAETYARAFEAQAAALDPRARNAGEDALGALFGSKDVSRAVAAQAAAASGVQADIIRKVMPVLTSVLIGGVIKAAQASQAAAPEAGSDGPFPGPFGAFWNELLRDSTRRPEADAPADAPRNPFNDWARAFRPESDKTDGGKTGGGGPESAANDSAAPSNPMGEMMAEIFGGMFGARTAADPVTRESTPDPVEAPAQEPEPGETAETTPFDKMLETSRELSAQNARAMEQIFETFFSEEKGGPRKPPA